MAIRTTKGMLPESDLERTVIFEDKPKEFSIAVEWRYGGELVRRDAHVVLKDPLIPSEAGVGGVG